MVDAQLLTEVFAQAVGDLSGEGDFGQEIEHLPSLGEGALDEFGVNLRFSAGRYPFEEHHLVVVPTADNRVVGRLLGFAQGAVEPSRQGFVGLQTAHFDVDALQDAALDEGGEGRCGVVAEASDEVVAAHVGDEVGIVEGESGRGTSEFGEGEEGFMLPRGATEGLEGGIESGLVAVGRGEAVLQFGLRLEGLTHAFFDLDDATFDQPLHGRHHPRSTDRLAHIGQRLRPGGERADDGALHFAEVVVIEVGVFGHGKEGFALQFEPRWQGGFHHFSGMAEVVVGHPAPEVNLVFEQEWLGVHEFFDVFELVGRQRGRVLVEAEDDAGVAFGLSERNDHARAHPHALFEERRDAVGVGTGDGEGEDDVGKHVGRRFWGRSGGGRR